MSGRALEESLSEFDRLKTRYGSGRSLEKRAALRALRRAEIPRPADLIAYHEILCYLRAFPDDADVLAESEQELHRFADRIEVCRRAHGGELPASLHDTGIVGTLYHYPYGLPMAAWLVARFGGAVDIDWEEYGSREEDDLSGLLVPFASWAETAALDDELLGSEEWFDKTGGARRAGALVRLLSRLGAARLPLEVCESLYNGLNLPIRWDLGGGGGLGKAASAASASRTLLRMPGERPYFQRGPLRGRTRHLAAEIARPLKRVRPAGRSRARAWIDCVRCALSVRERELYPIALASEGEVYEVPVGRGVRIVLFGMLAERRLPIETDYGAFVVRNGMPIGYGVAALLFDRVEIAVNIFPTFRQGESSFVFEQFARLFRHQFGSRVFLVERYQLGHENDEGLDAGSFWFYYKLGFRPVDPKVRALADAEASRLARERGARTGRRMLKRLARSNVAFAPDGALPSAEREISLTRIGLAVSRSIEERFAGDKRQAERVCAGEAAKILGASGRGEWSADERAAFARLSPLVVILPGIEGWPARDRRALIRLLRAKGSRLEGTYAILACGNARFQGALEALGSVR